MRFDSLFTWYTFYTDSPHINVSKLCLLDKMCFFYISVVSSSLEPAGKMPWETEKLIVISYFLSFLLFWIWLTCRTGKWERLLHSDCPSGFHLGGYRRCTGWPSSDLTSLYWLPGSPVQCGVTTYSQNVNSTVHSAPVQYSTGYRYIVYKIEH